MNVRVRVLQDSVSYLPIRTITCTCVVTDTCFRGDRFAFLFDSVQKPEYAKEQVPIAEWTTRMTQSTILTMRDVHVSDVAAKRSN